MSERSLRRRWASGLRHPVRALSWRYRRTPVAPAVDRLVRAVRRRRNRSLVDRFHLALDWLKRNTSENGGVRLGNTISLPYPEVTGYLIPSLLAWGERPFADRLATWLVTQQNADGSWSDPRRTAPYAFDTGQVLRGLTALLPTRPGLEPAVRRGADWLAGRVTDSGEIVTPSTGSWAVVDGVAVPPAIHLYAVPPLERAGRVLNTQRWDGAVARARSYYMGSGNPADVDALSHFHAYIVTAMLELGATNLAAEAMRATAARQRADGGVPGYGTAKWIDTPALFQYADIWYRLGEVDRADAVFTHGAKLQSRSGGFPGSVGSGVRLYRDEEVSWAVKFFLDALRSKIGAAFDRAAGHFPDAVDHSDGRLRLLLAVLDAAAPDAAVDLGCGRGRFLRALRQLRPALGLTGLDVSARMLADLPPGVAGMTGSLLDLPFADGSLDFAFSVEALEHAVNIPAALREMSRVLAPGGTLVIIDKNREKRGLLEIEEWEQWFDADEVAAELQAAGLEVAINRNIAYDDRDGSDGLFLGWVARRP